MVSVMSQGGRPGVHRPASGSRWTLAPECRCRTPPARDVVRLEVAAEGLLRPVSLTSAAGALAVVQVPGGRSWGVVPSVDVAGRVDVALHDLSTPPHRLIGRQTLQRGVAARSEDAEGVVTVTLAAR